MTNHVKCVNSLPLEKKTKKKCEWNKSIGINGRNAAISFMKTVLSMKVKWHWCSVRWNPSIFCVILHQSLNLTKNDNKNKNEKKNKEKKKIKLYYLNLNINDSYRIFQLPFRMIWKMFLIISMTFIAQSIFNIFKYINKILTFFFLFSSYSHSFNWIPF